MVSLAGCGSDQDPSTDSVPTTNSPRTETQTPSDKEPPTIERFEAIPEEAGTVLHVVMEVRDDRELEAAAFEYGEQRITTQLEGTKADVDKRFTDITTASSSESTPVRYRVTDASGNETGGQVSLDSTAPSLSVKPQTSNTAGNLQLTIEAEDNVGLHEIRVQLNGEEALQKSVTGNKSISRDITVSTESSSQAVVGERNRIGVAVVDTVGNSTRKEVEQYVRKYDRMEDTRLDLGGIYISQAGDALTNNLSDEVDTEPRVGIYNSPIPPEITSRHIDQMTGFGFNRVVYDWGGVPQSGWSDAFFKSDLVNEVEVMPFYIIPRLQRNVDGSWKEDVFAEDFPYLKEKFLTRENAATYDGRPVCSTWNYMLLHDDDELRQKLMDEFGSFEAFVQYIRDGLRTERGDPYLICGVGGWGNVLDEENRAELASQFDAITTWFHGTRGGWDAVLDRAEEAFKGCREFVEGRDMEFIPIARPGYDERWDTGDYRTTNRYLPRDPDRFRHLLSLGDEYRTTDRMNIPFNDWIEGHTIEPGTFTGTNYGTEYLEIVKEFQQPTE